MMISKPMGMCPWCGCDQFRSVTIMSDGRVVGEHWEHPPMASCPLVGARMTVDGWRAVIQDPIRRKIKTEPRSAWWVRLWCEIVGHRWVCGWKIVDGRYETKCARCESKGWASY